MKQVKRAIGIVLVSLVLTSCVSSQQVYHNKYPFYRPDGTVFASQEEYQQYAREHPEGWGFENNAAYIKWVAEHPEYQQEGNVASANSSEGGISGWDVLKGVMLFPVAVLMLAIAAGAHYEAKYPSIHCYTYTYKDQYHVKRY